MTDSQATKLIDAARMIGFACLLAVVIGVLAGALNGWAIGTYEDFILEQQQRARDAPGGLKRYVWVRTMHFALPLAIGGFAALVSIRRWAHVDGFITLVPLACGALIGWLVAQLVGAAIASDWQAVASTVTVPAVLFAVIPALVLIKEH